VTEGTLPDPSTAGDDGSTGTPVESSGGQTVEEVEAFWRNRFSQRDRAHNAETENLKGQMEAMRAQPVPPPAGESPEQARIRELETNLSREQAARQAEALQRQYPLSAGVLGEAIANLPPEKIAAMEAAFEAGQGQGGQGGPPIIDPNAARRGAPGLPGANPSQKPLNEKTKDELLADLRRATPAFVEAQREGF
jgi:hypothetical protein